MAKRKVINKNNIPKRPPLFKAGICFFAADYYNAPGWVWGALGLFWFLIILLGLKMWTEEEELPETL